MYHISKWMWILGEPSNNLTRTQSYTIDMTQCGEFYVPCWPKSPREFDVPCWPKLREEKCFQSSLTGIVSNVERTRNDALHWIGELQEIDPTSFSQVKINARYTQKSDDVFNLTSPLAILNATMRCGFDFRLLPLDILVMRECKIENIFPHLSTRWRATFSSKEHQKFKW
jgi:hypothetical protein